MVLIKGSDEGVRIRVRAIIEVLGKPKEHIEKALKDFVKKIKQDKDFDVKIEKIAEAQPQDNMWSTFAELEFITKRVSALTGFCFDYMPSSIEIMEPEELKMKNNDISNFFNDLQTKLHNIDMMLKQANNENQFLRKNSNALLRNLITISLHKSPKDLDKLSKITGVEAKELKKYIGALMKLGIIKEDKGIYSIVKNE